MPIVLVHGVPETPAVWELLQPHLSGDVITLQLPGFGCERPESFAATKEDYVSWLVGKLERLAGTGPLDVVGHDWGGGLVVRVVSTRPELVRSWVTDAAGLGDDGFEWHDFAKLWQTPGAGEAFWEEQLSRPPEERAALFEGAGAPRELAVRIAAACDRTMAECILALYRSAIDVGREWGPEFEDVARPGLVLVPSDDPFLSADGARAAAARAGAAATILEGVGHWWMLQDPGRGGEALRAFWSTVDGQPPRSP